MSIMKSFKQNNSKNPLLHGAKWTLNTLGPYSSTKLYKPGQPNKYLKTCNQPIRDDIGKPNIHTDHTML